MAVDVQSLMSQLSILTSESSTTQSLTTGEDDRTLLALNNEHSKQQEAKQVLQSMTQAFSKPSPQHQPGNDNGIAPTVMGQKSITSHEYSEQKTFLSVPVSQTGLRTRICSSECPCTCHTQTMLKTPHALRDIAGRLFLGYSGRPVLQQNCLSSCFARDTKPTTLTFFFPSWFAKQVISLTMANTAFNTPTFSIKVRRVVSEVSPLFAFSRNNAKGIQKLFDDRLASPDDVHAKGGWTPLHVSRQTPVFRDVRD